MKTKLWFRTCLFLAASALALQAGPKPIIELRRDQDSRSNITTEQETEQQRRLTDPGDNGEVTGSDEQENDGVTYNDQINEYYQQYQQRLYPGCWGDWKSNETIWFERAVEENNFGNINAAASALEIAKVWGEAEKNNRIVNNNYKYRYYSRTPSWFPPCVQRFLLLTYMVQA